LHNVGGLVALIGLTSVLGPAWVAALRWVLRHQPRPRHAGATAAVVLAALMSRSRREAPAQLRQRHTDCASIRWAARCRAAL